MKILKEISDASLGIGEAERFGQKYELRKSARAVLKQEDGLIAIQHLKNHRHHKLPGGGVDQGESIEEALKREVREEVGCNCVIEHSLGLVIEYRAKFEMIHLSYGFVVNVKGEVFDPELEQEEIDEGMETIWMSPEEAVKRMKTDTPDVYQGPFILARELAFLEGFLESTC